MIDRYETLHYGEFSQFLFVSIVQLRTNTGCFLYNPTMVIFHVIMIMQIRPTLKRHRVFSVFCLNWVSCSVLGGGFKYVLCSPLFGEDSHFDQYFSNGLVQPPTSCLFGFTCISTSKQNDYLDVPER